MSEITLKHGRRYRNRKGGTVGVYKVDRLKKYPFTDTLGAYYSEKGKVWDGRESEYDLVEEIE